MNKLKSFEDHLDKYRGKKGTDSRTEYDAESLAFRLSVMLKETRKSCNITQEELAEGLEPRRVIFQELKQVKAKSNFQPS